MLNRLKAQALRLAPTALFVTVCSMAQNAIELPRPSAQDPLSLAASLVGSPVSAKRQALVHLGEEIGATDSLRAVSDVSVAFPILTDDGRTGAVVEYTLDRSSSVAAVLLKSGSRWSLIGRFFYWWHWNPEEARHLLELREIVTPGVKDIVVREIGGGTGIAEESTSIFRVRQGALARVFQTVTNSETAMFGAGSERSRSVRTSLDFIARTQETPAAISALTSVAETSATTSEVIQRKCVVMQWDEASFRFIEGVAEESAQSCKSALEKWRRMAIGRVRPLR